MDFVSGIAWKQMFESTVPVLELVLRGSLMYLSLFTMLRIVLRREAASVTLPDLLLVVLLSDASQNAMAGEYHSITDGLVLVGTLIFWNYALDRLAFRFPLIGRFVHPPPLPLVRNGRMLRRNMRQEYITEEELWTQLREQGVEDLAKVKLAQMEGDGMISVIKRE